MKDILLVDDDETVRFLMNTQFSMKGWQSKLFQDTMELQEYLVGKESMPLLLLLDINLPNEDGDQFVQRMVDYLNGFDHLHIVFLSEERDTITVPEELRVGVSFSSKADVMSNIEEYLD